MTITLSEWTANLILISILNIVFWTSFLIFIATLFDVFYIYCVNVYKCFEYIQWCKSTIYMFRENAVNSKLMLLQRIIFSPRNKHCSFYPKVGLYLENLCSHVPWKEACAVWRRQTSSVKRRQNKGDATHTCNSLVSYSEKIYSIF